MQANAVLYQNTLLLWLRIARAVEIHSYLSTTYRIQVNATLEGHWDAAGGFLFESSNRQQDAAVILGLNKGYDSRDDFFAPSSQRVASTVAAFSSTFCSQFPVNGVDSGKGIPGVLFGRYQGDTYAGGNPWVLTTSALASLFYRAGLHSLQHGMPSEAALLPWQGLFGLASPPANSSQLADVFGRAGDSVLLRLAAHVGGDGGHLNEQLDKASGVQVH